MLAIISVPGQGLLRFDLQPEPVVREVEDELRFILDDYPARKDALWDLDFDTAKLFLLKLYYEARDAGAVERLASILSALGAFGPAVPFAASLARENLDAELPDLRLVATQTLGSFGDLTCVDVLLKQAESPEPDIALAALISLCRIGDPTTADRLIAAAQARGDVELEQAVAIGVARRHALESGEDAEDRLVTMSLASRWLYEDLFGLARFLVNQIADAINDRDQPHEARWRGARVMAVTGVASKQMTNVALRIATDENEGLDIRLELVRYLGHARAVGAAAMLTSVLGTPHPMLQEAAIAALGRIGDSVALEPLLNHYDDRAGAVRSLIEAAVGELASPITEDVYRAWLAGERALNPDKAYFLQPDLTTKFSSRPWRDGMQSSLPKARREVCLLLALFASSPGAVVLLHKLVLTEPDELTRAVATRAGELVAARVGPIR